MQLIRVSDYRRMKWKNGGGETAEVAICPPGSALDSFDWRISMARIETDGPFSTFAGVDRSLAVIHGTGLRLEIAGRVTQELRAHSPPCAFAADVPTAAALIAGPITDLNVMTRRERFAHRLRRAELSASVALRLEAPLTFLVGAAGRVRATQSGQTLEIGREDTLACGEPGAPVLLAPEADAAVFVIELTPR